MLGPDAIPVHKTNQMRRLIQGGLARLHDTVVFGRKPR
jgi:hypothetical protein